MSQQPNNKSQIKKDQIAAPLKQVIEPGKSVNTNKNIPKKAAAHRKVIEDAARFEQHTAPESSPEQSASNNTITNNTADDYEAAKVSKNRRSAHEEEIRMVRDLDRWGNI